MHMLASQLKRHGKCSLAQPSPKHHSQRLPTYMLCAPIQRNSLPLRDAYTRFVKLRVWALDRSITLVVRALPTGVLHGLDKRYCTTRVNIIRSNQGHVLDRVELTSIDLDDLGQGEANFIPVHRGLVSLQGIALKVHRLELFLVGEFALNFLETGQFAVACPELGQVGKAREAGQVVDGVGADVDDAQVGVVLQAGKVGEEVVRDVEFFEVGEGGEAGDAAEAVGLDAEDLEIGEVVQASYFCDLVLAEPEFLEVGEGVQAADFADAVCAELDLP